VNLSQMKKFYLLWPATEIVQTPSEKSPTDKYVALSRIAGSAMLQTPSPELLTRIASRFPLPRSSYVRMLEQRKLNRAMK